jgi:hypothetical protein
MAESFFLPPNTKRVPPPERVPEAPNSARWRHFLWYRRGIETIISNVVYQGGRWNGPLTAAQITAITAAGHGARIYTVNHPGELPADIDS